MLQCSGSNTYQRVEGECQDAAAGDQGLNGTDRHLMAAEPLTDLEVDACDLLDTISRVAALVMDVTGARIQLLNEAGNLLASRSSSTEGTNVYIASEDARKVEESLHRSLENLTAAFNQLKTLSVHQSVKDAPLLAYRKGVCHCDHGEHG